MQTKLETKVHRATARNDFIERNLVPGIAASVVMLLYGGFGLFPFLTGIKADYVSELQPFTQIISFSVYQFIEANFSTLGLLIVYEVLLPAFCFFLLVKIFRIYLDDFWSLAFALVAIAAFPELNFRDFLVFLFSGNLISTPTNPTIMGGVSFSTAIFLLVFYISLEKFKYPSHRITFITVMWAVFSQVSRIDALFGLAFWFAYFPVRLLRQGRGLSRVDILKEIALQFFVALVIVFPALASVPSFSGFHHVQLGLYYHVVYFVAPVCLMVLTYYIQKVDIFELFVKFWHVYFLMIVEFVLVLLGDVFNFGVDFNILKSRIPLFFLHFYYFVPVVYFLMKEYRGFSQGRESKPIAQLVRKGLYLAFGRIHRYYLPFVMVCVVIFIILNCQANYHSRNLLG